MNRLKFFSKMAESLLEQQVRCNRVKIDFGHLAVTNMSGSTQATTFSHNRGGSYARVRKIPVNPRTTSQTVIRNEFGALSSQWKTLTVAQRLTWTSNVGSFPRKDTLGKTIILSGINLFKSLNQNLFDIGVATINTAPTPLGAVNVNSMSVAVAAGAATMVATFAPTPIATGNSIIVFATAQVSPGVSFLKNKYRKIQVLPAATATGVSLEAAYVAKFGATIAGQKIGFKFVAVSSVSGEKSVGIEFQAIVAA